MRLQNFCATRLQGDHQRPPKLIRLFWPRGLLLPPNKDNVVLRNGQTTPSKSVNGRLRRDPSNEVGRSSSLQALLTNFLRREVSPLRVSFH
ncbi:hypothetical protein V8E54_006289 [Elaphomyces granulatus]